MADSSNEKVLEAFLDALCYQTPGDESPPEFVSGARFRTTPQARLIIRALDLWAEGNGLKRGHLRAPSLEEQYRAIAERMLSMKIDKVRGLRFNAADDLWVCENGTISVHGSDVAQEWRRQNPPTGDGTFEIPEESREFHNKMEAAALTRVASTLLAAKAGGAVYGVQKQGEAWLGITEAGHMKHAINHAEVDEAYQAEVRMNKAHRPPDVRYAIQRAAEKLLEKANNGRHVEGIEYHPLKDTWTANCMGGTVTVLGVYVLEEAGLKRPPEEATHILEQGTTIEGPNAGFHIKDLEQAAAELLKESAEGRAVRSVMYVALHDKWSGQVHEPDYRGALVVSGETVRSRVKAKHG